MSRKKKTKRTKAPEPEQAQEVAAGEDPAARIADLEATLLRAQADYKNLRRRSLADLEAGIQRAMQPLLEDLLLVLDFLDMAMDSPAEQPETKNLLLGIEMTRTKFVSALEGSEVREIPTDIPFDPAIHDATSTEVTTEHEPGTILRAVRKGYTWQGRVLRPAQVVVAAAPEEPSAEASELHPQEESDESEAPSAT